MSEINKKIPDSKIPEDQVNPPFSWLVYPSNTNTRGRRTIADLRENFHTDADAGSILAIYAQSLALRGGTHYLSRLADIHDAMASAYPESLELLKRLWCWHRFDPSVNRKVFMHRPIIAEREGMWQINFGLSFLSEKCSHEPLRGGSSANGSEDEPSISLTPVRREAAYNLLAIAHQQRIPIPQEPGDILFVNNLDVMHARDAFEDESERPAVGLRRNRTRHLLRLWLWDRDCRPIAKELQYIPNLELGRSPDKQLLQTFNESLESQ